MCNIDEKVCTIIFSNLPIDGCNDPLERVGVSFTYLRTGKEFDETRFLTFPRFYRFRFRR